MRLRDMYVGLLTGGGGEVNQAAKVANLFLIVYELFASANHSQTSEFSNIIFLCFSNSSISRDSRIVTQGFPTYFLFL